MNWRTSLSLFFNDQKKIDFGSKNSVGKKQNESKLKFPQFFKRKFSFSDITLFCLLDFLVLLYRDNELILNLPLLNKLKIQNKIHKTILQHENTI